MSVTVVASIQAQPGRGGALVATLALLLAPSTPAAPGRQMARLLHSADAPERLLYVGQWDSREAYLAHAQVDGTLPHTALRAGATTHQFFDQLALYEDMSRQAAMAACVTITAPPAMAAAVRAFVDRQGRQELVGRPGFVLRGVYQDQDVTERLFVMHGWDSPAALETFVRTTAPTLNAQMAEWGASIDVFTGRIRAEVDRYSVPGSAPAVPQSTPY